MKLLLRTVPSPRAQPEDKDCSQQGNLHAKPKTALKYCAKKNRGERMGEGVKEEI